MLGWFANIDIGWRRQLMKGAYHDLVCSSFMGQLS